MARINGHKVVRTSSVNGKRATTPLAQNSRRYLFLPLVALIFSVYVSSSMPLSSFFSFCSLWFHSFLTAIPSWLLLIVNFTASIAFNPLAKPPPIATSSTFTVSITHAFLMLAIVTVLMPTDLRGSYRLGNVESNGILSTIISDKRKSPPISTAETLAAKTMSYTLSTISTFAPFPRFFFQIHVETEAPTKKTTTCVLSKSSTFAALSIWQHRLFALPNFVALMFSWCSRFPPISAPSPTSTPPPVSAPLPDRFPSSLSSSPVVISPPTTPPPVSMQKPASTPTPVATPTRCHANASSHASASSHANASYHVNANCHASAYCHANTGCYTNANRYNRDVIASNIGLDVIDPRNTNLFATLSPVANDFRNQRRRPSASFVSFPA